MHNDKSTPLNVVIDTLRSPLGKIVAWLLVALIGIGGTAIALEVTMVNAAIILVVVGVAVGIAVFLGSIFGG